MQKQLQRSRTVVDLFSGCGGFSIGAESAGFHSIAAIDIEPTLQSAYRSNFTSSNAIQASVADIDAPAWKEITGRIRPDLVIGGPPCQGFSWIGKRQTSDPRNSLIRHFYRHINLLRPKAFVMENVCGLLDEQNIHMLWNALESLPGRYKVLEPMMINAADFGAATNRRRVIVVGYDPSEVDPLTLESLSRPVVKVASTVRDAIYDLPSPISEMDDSSFGWVKYPDRPSRTLSSYAERLRRPPPRGLGARDAVAKHGRGYVSGMKATVHSAAVAKRYAKTEGGKIDHTTKSYRLEWDGQCPTLRAGTGADKGSFQAVRPLHPGKPRVITVREAARLQGFPDWFVFHSTKWHSFRMIGNSVSPFVSKAVLRRIRSKME